MMIGQIDERSTQPEPCRRATNHVHDALICAGMLILLIAVPAVISVLLVKAAEFVGAHVDLPNIIMFRN